MQDDPRDASASPTSLASVQEALRHGLPKQKLHLLLGHIYLVPWFVQRCFDCELPLKPFLDVNPDLELGGLPIASKLSRYGTEPPYLPSLRIGTEPDPEAIAQFTDAHSFPFVLKPLFGSRGRGVQKVNGLNDIRRAVGTEPMVLQPYVEAPKEYGINVMRVGDRLRIYGLTEVPVRAVWGDGRRPLRTLAREKYDADVASKIENGGWTPSEGQHVPLRVASCPSAGPACRDRIESVTPALRTACEQAADQIGLRFGRFDVKSRSLDALQAGDFHVLEANGSTSLDLTLYDDKYSLSEKIERLRAHWDEFFHQAQPCDSPLENSWQLLGTLLWFAIAPGRCVGSFRHEVDDRELAARP